MTETKSKNLFDPPDPALVELAARVNKTTRTGKLSFCAMAGDVSVIFQDRSRRAVIRLDGMPSEGDIEALVTALESWTGFQGDDSRYTTEVPPLPESSWS